MPRKQPEISPAPDGRPHEEQPRWRQDFPIDVPQDNYIARRDFTKFMVLTSGAFVFGQVFIGADSLLRTGAAPAEKAIARVDEVPIGGSLTFRYPNHEQCLLLRPDEQTFLAYSNKCTHLHCPVRPMMEESKLQCPCHNGWFDMETGRPLAGPPRRPLPRITLDIREGTIYATGIELST